MKHKLIKVNRHLPENAVKPLAPLDACYLTGLALAMGI